MRTFRVTMSRGTSYEEFEIKAKFYLASNSGRTITFYRKDGSDAFDQEEVVAIIGTALLVSIIVIGA